MIFYFIAMRPHLEKAVNDKIISTWRMPRQPANGSMGYCPRIAGESGQPRQSTFRPVC